MKQKTHVTIASLREQLQAKENTNIHLSYKSRRGKTVRVDGIVTATYPNLFIVTVTETTGSRNMSFNYSDIVSGEIMVLD
jgi:uncharacterized protein Veg